MAGVGTADRAETMGAGLHGDFDGGTPPAPERSPADGAPAATPETRDQERKIQLAGRLADTRLIVDRVLETVSSARLEARRLVTKELGIDPRPEILNTIVKVACDTGQGIVRRELPRHLLTVYALIEHELAGLMDSPELDAKQLRAGRDTLPILLDLCRQIQDEIAAAVADLTTEARDYLLQVCDSLSRPAEKINAARLLAPRLELFARARTEADLSAVAPSLDEPELRLLTRLFQGGATENSPGRICVNSIALRTLMCEDIARWESICSRATGPGVDVEVPADYLERMGQAKVAFHFVSERLQGRQDVAIQAGLQRFADEVRTFRQRLFTTYRRFSQALRDASGGRASATAPSDDSALRSLVDASEEADAASDEARARSQSKEKMYLKALTDMRQTERASGAEIVTPAAAELRAERRRMRALLGVAATLVLVCGVIYVPRFLASRPPEVTAADFSSAINVTHTLAVGRTLYAQVSNWLWEDLTQAEQVARVEALGDAARSRGLESVFLADEAGHELAFWSPARGVLLARTSR